jgi:ABC-type phosphate/phosphonate transport system substrate-binding protein
MSAGRHCGSRVTSLREPLYAFLAAYLADRIGRPSEFVVAESCERCAQDIDDVCFVCSVPYLLFADAGRIDMEVVAAPVVADGGTDAAAIDSQVLDIELRDHPELVAAVRRIGTIGPSTIQPVVVSRSGLTDEERHAITEALMGVADDPVGRDFLRAALVERFVPANGGTYDDIRRMFRRVRRAGLLDASWRARWRAITEAGSPPVSSLPRHTIADQEATSNSPNQ